MTRPADASLSHLSFSSSSSSPPPPLLLCALQQVARRTISSSARRQVENKVPQKQKLFQEDNGMPIHLKGGSSDAVLYRTTMALTVLDLLEHLRACMLSGLCRLVSLVFKTRALLFDPSPDRGTGYALYELVKASFPQQK
ncbi:Cytochrome c oxidase subunit 7A2, mitochondrial [Collichthys lucidus]|uniref:Cytochrome c oxidase subunit 7A2, mitochondrial n=1 Tax=Collichthys lucidus TaxID=240159 RepID=A0A4V6AQD7_COLLU|nr:Cytochrome c oxidase subunit 7A2, mitochondrial [Collichthys lucidus]